MEAVAGSFSPLLIVISLAFIVPLALTRFQRLRLPIVGGEILAGIVVGRSGFGWVTHEDPLLTLLAEFGFVFLMFLAGMEIDFANLSVELPGAARAGARRPAFLQLEPAVDADSGRSPSVWRAFC